MEEKKKSKWLKLLVVLNIYALIICVYSVGVLVIMNRQHLEHKPYAESERVALIEKMREEVQARKDVTIERSEIRPLVQSVLKPVFYIEVEKDIKESGLTIAQLRLIIIDKGLNDDWYAYTLMHEYVHLTRMIKDEALTDFETVKLLWESGNQFLERVCARLVIYKLTIFLGNEYDCTGELIEYFKGIY